MLLRTSFPGPIGRAIRRFNAVLNPLPDVLNSFSFIQEVLGTVILSLPDVKVRRESFDVTLGRICIKINLRFVSYKKCWSIGQLVEIEFVRVAVGGDLCIPIAAAYGAALALARKAPFSRGSAVSKAKDAVEKVVKSFAGGVIQPRPGPPALMCLRSFKGGGRDITIGDILGYLEDGRRHVGNFPFVRDMVAVVERILEEATIDLLSVPVDMPLPKLELEFGQLEELEDKADELSARSDRLKEEVEKLLQKPLEFFEAFAARAEERLETLP
eukprot:scaffold339_cov355-Pinguiococcus_pyrenoidosus.AAC.1